MNQGELIAQSRIIYSNDVIIRSIAALAVTLNKHYKNQAATILPVMTGVIPFAGYLLPKLDFNIHVSYAHVSRYQNNVGGDAMNTIHFPMDEEVNGKNILIVDDIHDEGKTLKFIHDKLLTQGARDIKSAVLFNKAIEHKVGYADFFCLEVPDSYVYGFGLDFNGIGRNIPHLYAHEK